MLKYLRADIIIATLALLISAGATLSSLYQTKVIANQLSASVWPYLTINSGISPHAYMLRVINDGLGPAIIRSATMTVDGKRISHYRDSLKLLPKLGNLTGGTPGSFASIGPTSVVRPGDQHVLVSISGNQIAEMGDLPKRVVLEVCYCSILDQCWDVIENIPRKAVTSCTSSEKLDF